MSSIFQQLATLLTSFSLSFAPIDTPLPPLFPGAEIFAAAIEESSKLPAVEATGILTPHHLLAVDLIAEAFSRVKNSNPRRVVILSPDHFFRASRPAAIPKRNFATAFGEATLSSAAEILAKNPHVETSNLFSHEHGIQAITPFVEYFWPEAEVLPIALRIDAEKAELDSIFESLRLLIDDETLVVQSTDFSHYLPPAKADARDNETLRVLASGDAERILKLNQPENIDSTAAAYLQSRIQNEIFGNVIQPLVDKNSDEYTQKFVAETTSYLPAIFSSEEIETENPKYFFAGDTHFGRGIAWKFGTPEKQEKLVAAVKEITGGRPLILNLEGAIAESCGDSRGDYDLCMPASLAIPALKNLNVAAVTLANNHRFDRGDEGYETMKKYLAEAEIPFVEPNKFIELPEFYLAALTDLDNFGKPKNRPIISDDDIEKLKEIPDDKPLVVFVHWGVEYQPEPTKRDRELSEKLKAAGAEMIVGAHPHVASAGLDCDDEACEVFSLGNFIFDQPWPDKVSGAVLSLDFLGRGNFFPRFETVPNFFTKL